VKDSFDLQNRPKWQTLYLTSFLVWLTPSLIGFIAKFWFLHSKHGFANVAGALSVNALSLGQRLSFFRADLVLALVLVPFCFLMARLLLPIRWYLWMVGTVTLIGVLLQLLAFVELVVLGNLAGYALLALGFEWGIAHPMAALAFLFAYNPLSSPVKPVALLGAAAVVILLGWRIIRPRRQALKNQIYSLAAVVWIVCASLAIASWFPWMRPTRFHSSMISLTVESLFPSESGAGKYQGLSIHALRPTYQQLANVPGLGSPRLYWGAAKDYDVVFFIMETGPAHILSADASLKDFPNLQRLSQRAWVGTQHYTTSPESYKAVSSILLSLYPTSHTQSFQRRAPPGLIRSLHVAGYQTGVYLPNVHGTMFAKQEEDYYETLGPDRMSTLVPAASPVPEGSSHGWQEAENLDLAALRELEKDLRVSASTGRRFFGIYLPQLSHEPWVDVSAEGNEHNMAKRRYNLMKVEDRHLGELIATLEKLGRLDRTLIVVACDHGLRSSESDSSFREGQVDDLTFHVPFLLYAPGIVTAQTNLPWPTSHIDITPSVLDLLGISDAREFEAGTPIWNAGLRDRCIFFFASQYFGADGYRCGDSFSMWNSMLNVTYTGRTLHFTASEAVAVDSQPYKEIVARVQGMGALRNAWYDAASRGAVALAASAPEPANR
jgi:sulfatase-like protein